MGMWSGEHTQRSEAPANDSASLNGLMGDIVDDVSHQLHAGIMKSVRRVLIDEIFSSILPDIIVSRKTEKQLAAKLKNQVTKVCLRRELCVTFPFQPLVTTPSCAVFCRLTV